jgi:hypothetical protein
MEAVPRRTKRPEVVTGRVMAVPRREAVRARRRSTPEPGRAAPEPGRANPESGRPLCDMGRTAGDGPLPLCGLALARLVPGRGSCAVALSSSRRSARPSSSTSESSIQCLEVSARHLSHHTCWSNALRSRSSVATAADASHLRRRRRESARNTCRGVGA